MANPLVINAAELLRRSGNDRDVALTVHPDELEVVDEHVAADADVDIQDEFDGTPAPGDAAAAPDQTPDPRSDQEDA